MILGYAIGTQEDVTLTNTDCYQQAYMTYQFAGNFLSALQNPHWLDSWWWNFMLMQGQAFAVNIADQAAACDSMSKIKQLSIRTTTYSGALNVLYTFLSGLITDSQFNQAFLNMFTAWGSGQCYNIGLSYGYFVSRLLEVYSPPQYLYPDTKYYDSH